MNKNIKRLVATTAGILTATMLMSACTVSNDEMVPDSSTASDSTASSSAPSSEPSSEASSEPSSEASSAPSSAPSSQPSSAPISSAGSSAPAPAPAAESKPAEAPAPVSSAPPPPAPESAPAVVEQMNVTAVRPTYYRNALSSDAERAAYDEIVAGVQNVSAQITLATSVSKDRISDIWQAILLDNPELFYLDNVTYSYDLGTGNATAITPIYHAFSPDIQTARANFDAALNKIVTEAAKKTNRYDQIFYVHHAISDATDFVLGSQLNQSAYSALVLGKTVCAGYAKSTMAVLNRLGIEAGVTRGTTMNGAHMWNVVPLNGQWYNLDVNFDDAGNPRGKYRNSFILVADSAMKTHVRDSLGASIFPACPKGYK